MVSVLPLATYALSLQHTDCPDSVDGLQLLGHASPITCLLEQRYLSGAQV